MRLWGPDPSSEERQTGISCDSERSSEVPCPERYCKEGVGIDSGGVSESPHYYYVQDDVNG